MIERGGQNSDVCAMRFRIGYYHMIFLQISMVDDSTFQRLVALGLRKLLIPWEENTPEQREYYGLLTKEGTDPLTISLDTLGDD